MKDYIKPTEFGKKFDLSQTVVNEWIRSGKLKAIKFENPHRNHYRIPISEVERIEKELISKINP